MINSIITGISQALYNQYGYENHMEEIKQDLKEPCFFITCINPTIKLFLGKRYLRENKFCIQYFSESEQRQTECNNVGETLLSILEYITVDGNLIRGNQMEFEVVDGVLNFFVNYDCFVYKVSQADIPMESMEKHIEVKDGEDNGR